MAWFLRRPAVIGALTAVLLSVPAAALAQSGHPAAKPAPHRAAVIRAWQELHKAKGIVEPASVAGKPARRAAGTRISKLASGVVGSLYDVARVSASDAWAVGYVCASACGTSSEVDNTLIEHWDGTSWTPSPSVSPSASYSQLTGVTALSSNDVWAVGSYCASSCGSTGTPVTDTLIEHWDGNSWTQATSVDPSPLTNSLVAVSADSPSDVWAVGLSCTAGCAKTMTLAEHYNGTSWSVVASPSPDKNLNVLTGVGVLAGGTAWADGQAGTTKSLTERWNGTSWSTVTTPSPGKYLTVQAGLAAQSASNVWAVGTYCSTCNKPTGYPVTLTLHWTGTKWAKVSSPNLGKGFSILEGVSADSATDAWAVGGGCASACGKNTEVDGALILHWTGKKWAKSAAASSTFAVLYGVSAAAGDSWAVGTACVSGCGTASEVDGTLIEHWDGTSWTVA